MGGGVLPIALYNGELMFLLGKEGGKRGGWSDFGGSREGNESQRQTAIREGAEELNGFFGTGKVFSDRVRDNHLITTRIVGFATYSFQVPYDPYLPDYFLGNHSLMKSNLASKIGRNGLFEKSEIAWFTADQLRSSFSILRPFYRTVAAQILRSLPKIYARLR